MDDSTTAAWRRARLRDGALAGLALGLLGCALAALGRLDALLDPGVAAIGVVGSLALEWVLLQRPERTRYLWERRWVQIGGVVLTVCGGAALLLVAGAWPVAVLCWGLVAYLALLAVVLTGRANPVSTLVRTGEDE